MRKLLVIVLRRDASTIKKGAKIERVEVFYQAVPAIGGGGVPVRSCRVNGMYQPPGPNDPCIRERNAFGRKHDHKREDCDDHDGHDREERDRRGHNGNNPPPSALSGDWEIVIEAFDNGRFTW